ncbi:site-specific integrase [Rhodococcus sp. 3A]|nr:site-specific integrase [Rhodococcus sp. 3A]MBC2638929.1 site-specific integrase [Rhodococcus sp. 3A]MBC2896330.1 site-specific integrase [Rhodococcus sp. 4CII]
MAGKPRKTAKRRSWGSVFELKSGRFRATYVGPDLVRYAAPHTFAATIDADGWLSSERRKIDLETWRPPGSEDQRGMTLEKYAERWLTQRTPKPRTRQLYADLLRLRINHGLGELPVARITPAAVRAWHAELETEPTRKAHAYALLHAILRTAVEDEVIPSNPCVIRKAMQTGSTREIEPLSPDELQALVWEMPKSLRAAVLLMGWCGLRVGEVKALMRRNIGPDAEWVRVERAVSHRSGQTMVDTPKTRAGTRTVAVPPHIRPAILAHLADLDDDDPYALLFPGAAGSFIPDWDIRRPFKLAADRIDKPSLRIHDLRHTGATLAAHAGATTKELMGRLGYVEIDTCRHEPSPRLIG